MSRPIAAGESLPARWGRFLARHRLAALLAILAVLIALVAIWQTFGGRLENRFTLPGTESQNAVNLIAARFPAQSGDTAQIVFFAQSGVASAAITDRISAVIAQAQKLPDVRAVGSPFTPGSGGAVSADGRTAFAGIQYDRSASTVPDAAVKQLFSLVDSSGGNGLRVEAGGTVVTAHERSQDRSELYGLIAAAIILLIAFGSVVAMGLPLATALTGLLAGFAIMFLLAHSLDLPSFAGEFIAMIGLGVGIDYALLVVTRFREALAGGKSVPEGVATTMDTAGRSVAFAGSAVSIAMIALVANGVPLITALGIAGAAVVLCAVAVAWSLLPTLLALIGHAIDRWSITPQKAPAHQSDSAASGFWYELARLIQARPIVWAVVAVFILVVLGLPVFRLQLGASDAGNNPTSLHSRRAYDLIAQGFGPGFNGPLTILLDLKGTAAQAATLGTTVQQAVSKAADVQVVTPPSADPAGDAVLLTAIPRTSPESRTTQQLVHTLRNTVLPHALAGTSVRSYVAGTVAGYIDIGDRITSRLPIFFLIVLGLSFLLLMTVFRSIPVALTAVVMNILSIGAAYGVLVAVFQWGWLSGIVGVKRGPIESYLPMMVFAIIFGLSMDYEVFLISRIREQYDATGKADAAVAAGLAATARVIMAGASIMVVVFLSFVLLDTRVIKEFGLGLAAAVIVDATVVRLALVPAVMQLLGDRNWWMPRWLDRALPHLDVEGGGRGDRG